MSTPTPQVILVGARDDERSFAELKQLVLGLGFTVAGEIVQKRGLGKGKLSELAAMTMDLVVIDDELTPAQQRHLEIALDTTVLDRTAIILRVFETRARTREAKLEVELARLKYELPRIRDDPDRGDREGGGGRGARGHTNVELAKQRTRDRIAAVRRELDALQSRAEQNRRSRPEVFTVAVVGYTNAGKSSLMRALTASDVLVEDKLFATLGTTVRPIAPPSKPPVLIVDTVGFIERLPHALIASFHSTLAEAHDAWLRLHVADASAPDFRLQMRVVEETLAARTAQLILNKADRLDPTERAALKSEFPEALVISALDEEDVRAVREHLEAQLEPHLREQTFELAYEEQKILAELRDQLEVVKEDYGEKVSVRVKGTEEALGRLAARLRRAELAGRSGRAPRSPRRD